MSARSAIAPPRVQSRWPLEALLIVALLSILAWLAVERLGGAPLHPRYVEMLAAARTLQDAGRVIASEKSTRGLMQSEVVDPNRTGLIGSEMTAITTTMGDLGSKRTVTNPDFAAALVRVIDELHLPRGTPVVLVVSGSFVGADIAALGAVEALGLRPVVIASLSASMFGATDPDFNLLDMLGLLRRRGLVKSAVAIAVLGGEKGVANEIDHETIKLLRASAAREETLLIDEPPYPKIVDRLLEQVDQVLGPGNKPGLVINVGGALVALGSCPESYALAPGLTRHPASCREGTPGLPLRVATRDHTPILHIINIRRMALDLGLPFDPKPLPQPGTNPAVYTAVGTSVDEINLGGIR
jgi:poly-gamma-glutamate system protein